VFTEGGSTMSGKFGRIGLLASLFALVVLCSTPAQEIKSTDEGKAGDYKGKSYDVKEKGDFAITLTFDSGTKATVTAKGDKKGDLSVAVYPGDTVNKDSKAVGKSDKAGQEATVTFNVDKSGKHTIVVHNAGDANKVSLKVDVAKK